MRVASLLIPIFFELVSDLESIVVVTGMGNLVLARLFVKMITGRLCIAYDWRR